MNVNKLTFRNFRCYEDLTIEFNSRLTVLVAANGEGKTSILDALRIAVWPFVSQFDLARTAYSDPANGVQIDGVQATIAGEWPRGRSDSLDPASNYRQFEDWFISVFRAAREQQRAALEKGGSASLDETPYYTMIRVIQRAINTVLGTVGWQELNYSETHGQALVLFNRDQGIFKVPQLSDGIKNMLGMVAAIALRGVLLNSHLGESAAERLKEWW